MVQNSTQLQLTLSPFKTGLLGFFALIYEIFQLRNILKVWSVVLLTYCYSSLLLMYDDSILLQFSVTSLLFSLSLSYFKQPPKFQILQWAESVQPGCILQAPAIDYQPRQWRRRGKQSRGSGSVAGQSESCSSSAILLTCPPQSLRALLSDWLGFQAPAGYHHLY